MEGTPGPETVSTKLQRVAQLARQAPQAVLTNLSHHIDVTWLWMAFQRTRKDGATGVDGQNADQYEADLGSNLASLLERARSGTYRAPPVRRVHIPKGDGKSTRPIGIPTFEDKVLQRAVVMVLEAVYEQDFMDCSYGFRPGRSAHQALEVFWQQMTKMGGGWVLEVDIKGYFDTIEHGHLREMLGRRVNDGVLTRLIGKWLNAGVMEDGALSHPDTGTPQGGVVSPLLANVYLHEVLDKWFAKEVLPRLKGRAFLVRYADDFVIGFAREEDARRVWGVLAKRFGRYGLTLHPEKTRLVPFKPRFAKGKDDRPAPGSFDLLGFTHYWGLSRKGSWCIKRKTAKGRLKRACKKIAEWCRKAMHLPVAEQHRTLTKKLNGHCEYYGITGNSHALTDFREAVRRTWKHWLGRRSNEGMTWERFGQLEKVFRLPAARVVHSMMQPNAARP